MNAMRELGVTQQVGLLFVGIFGVLVLASLWVFVRSLRERSEAQRERDTRVARELRAVWIGAALFWVAWASGAFVSTVLFGIVSFVALRELITLTHTRRADHRALLAAFFVVLPLQYVLVGTRHFDLFTVFIPVYVFFAIPVLSALGNDPERFLERTAKIQWGIMVCVYGMSHAPALLLLELPGNAGRGAFLVMFLVLVVAAGQIAQEAASRRLRRRPVARAISRSFSWRAWGVGSAAAGVLGALLFWTTPFDPLTAFGLGVVAGASAALGDLVMRALERDAGVRQWGGQVSVTGAVGLLDRVARLCFAAPVFFHAVRSQGGA
jgi:phosphatidate cytidylyltransferase